MGRALGAVILVAPYDGGDPRAPLQEARAGTASLGHCVVLVIGGDLGALVRQERAS